ncbi:hypothetical protein EDB89DRAFT_1887555 [Lactarius sanguifluus]|nr:hypothetical protein EDB89DRAFT_1887555 [Lactarius sanguifluus]
MALVHDDDLERILGVGDGAALDALQPDVVMDYLQRSKPEIGVMSDSWTANKGSPRADEKGTTIAMLSEQLHSLYPTASVPLPSHSPGGVTDTKEIANYRDLSNRFRNFSGSGSAITESEIYVDDLVNIIERSSFDDFARSPYRSNPETYSSDSETIASGGTSDVDFDTDVEFEGIAPDDLIQHTFSPEQHTDWYVADPNKETGASVIHVTNVGSDDDEDSDVLETGSRDLALAAIRRGGIAIRLPFPRSRSFHASHPDLVPREDITTAVRQPSHNDAEDTSVNATSPNRDQQPLLPPATSAGILPTDDSGVHMRQGTSLDNIMSVGDLESLDKRKSKDKEEGKDEDFDFSRIIGLPSSSSKVVPRAEADDTTGLRRPSTAMLDDSFAGSLPHDDPDHALRRNVWSFIRQRERVSQPPRRPDGNPRHWDVWRCSQIGQIRIERAIVRDLDPDKPSHQRLNAEHDVDPDSANTLGGPTAVVHRHSRALAFSIFRNYSSRNHRSGRTHNSTATRTAKSKETRAPVMSTHDVILLATKRVQGRLTADSRRNTRREPNPIHSPQDWLASSPQQVPPSPHHIVDQSRPEGLNQTSSIRGTTPSHVSGSLLDLSGVTASTSFASTLQSVTSTAPVLSSLGSSYTPERQLSPHDEAEEDGDSESMNPVSRISRAEAFATFLDERANDQLKNEQVPAPATRRWFQRSIGSTGSSSPRTLSSGLDPINPPWMKLVQHSTKEERDSAIQDLRLAFKDVGLHSLPRSKGRAGAGRKGKGKNKDVLTQVPDDSLFMLLPLWPHETDPASTVGEQRQRTPRDQEQNLYLLVYYAPLYEQSEAKRRWVRLQKGERERQHPTPLFDLRGGFKVIGQLIAHSDLNGSGIRLPARGLSVTGPLEEAELGVPPASLRDVHPDGFVMGACLDGSGTAIEFFPRALEKLGLCVPRTELLHTGPAEPAVEQPLTAIGRAAVEVAWLGCMALMTFYGPQSQGPA